MDKVTASAPGFAPVPTRLLTDKRITDPTTITVYCALASFADYGTGKCFPGLRTIGARARCSEDTAARHVALLARLGYVQKTSGRASGRANTYHLTDAWGRKEAAVPVPEGYRTGAVGGAVPVQDERDPGNETQERGGNEAAPLPAAQLPEEEILRELADVPGLRHDRRFRAGARQLLSEGTNAAELVRVVRWAAGDPRERGCLSYVFDRFPRWARKARELEERRPRPNIEEIRDRERLAEQERAAALAGPRLTEEQTRAAWARIAGGT